MKQITTSLVKKYFRDNCTIYVDHAKDSQDILKYIYRLERMEIIWPQFENKEFNMSIYGLTGKGKINFIK
jgi:hypothetical protein